ncbi:class I SAM-dependent methyltransferase [Nocardioides sp. URHA0020]|uniref:class I SAM-dependent methyltransferase n=1 Tax=Nocardioides sp. URHA0020 TaxID=1380392 RepID=UPI0006876150|nr:class I SAM-dependent methyltransferase [Nocardioides sp. URHA0020]
MSPTDAPRGSVTALEVDDEGLLVRGAGDGPVDFLFGDQRVGSFWLRRDTRPEGEWLRYPWPATLRRFLNGVVTVTLADPADGTRWTSYDARLGSGEGTVEVRDAQGHALALDKSNRLTRLFGDRDAAQLEPLLDALEVVIGALEKAGVEPFLAYGTLLGAVRDQDFIGHDSDADVGYVSRFEFPVDVVRESYALQRRLREMGFRVQRYSGLGLKVILEEPGGTSRGLDVFGGFSRDGMLYLMGEVGHPFRDEWLHPRTSATLAGREFPVPARPEHLLEAMYGESWRLPDPAFKFVTPVSTQRRLNGWFRGARVGLDDRWARSRAGTLPPERTGPSELVRWVAGQEPVLGTVVDVGCGRGSDALWLAAQGARTVGLDYFPPDLRRAVRRAERRGVEVRFEWMNLGELRSVLGAGTWLAREEGPRIMLAHHLVDATDRRGRANLVRLAKMVTRSSGRLYVQAYTAPTELSGRLGLDPVDAEQLSELVVSSGGRVEQVVELGEREAGMGEAPPGGPPVICRMVASWTR